MLCHDYLFLSDLQYKHDCAEKSSLQKAYMVTSRVLDTFRSYLVDTDRKNEPVLSHTNPTFSI